MPDRGIMRVAALVGGLLLYGILGSPTPDHPGWVELLVGLALVAAVGPVHGLALLRPQARFAHRWQRAGQWLLLYGLTVPVVGGLINGNDPGHMVRDFLPFLFMLMPLFLADRLAEREGGLRAIVGAAVWVGLAFAVRSFFHGGQFEPATALLRPVSAELLYLANAPTVLFTAVLLAGIGFERLAGWPGVARLGGGLLAAVLCAVVVTAMALVLQRASIGYFGFALSVLVLLYALRSPFRALVPFAIAAGIGAILWPQITALLSVLVEKTMVVGLNNRFEEARAVFAALDGSVLSVVFGKGWGATFASPAVGGETVNFTHSLVTAFWLKTGLAGLVLAVFYIGALAMRLVPLAGDKPVMALALAGPLAIAVFLYASYKSFDFGVLLLLTALAGSGSRALHGSGEWCNEKPAPVFDHPGQETTGHAVKGAH